MAISGVGTLLRKWVAGTGWVNIAEIRNITGPSMSKDTYDTTTLATQGGYRTFIAGFKNGGTINLTCNFTNAAYTLMKADFESDDLQNYELVLPDEEASSFEFSGLVTECPLNIPEDIITFEVTIQISGAVEMESGTGSGS